MTVLCACSLEMRHLMLAELHSAPLWTGYLCVLCCVESVWSESSFTVTSVCCACMQCSTAIHVASNTRRTSWSSMSRLTATSPTTVARTASKVCSSITYICTSMQGWKLAPALSRSILCWAYRNLEWASKILCYFNTDYGVWEQIVRFGSCRAGRQKVSFPSCLWCTHDFASHNYIWINVVLSA